jgi:acyl-coenzyme A synthetase/AMP-(fatty) acid ligase
MAAGATRSEHDNASSVLMVLDDTSAFPAYVIREPGADSDSELADELRAWCKQRMRRYEYPHLVQFVDDLPRTVNGKVQRFRLRELATTATVSA